MFKNVKSLDDYRLCIILRSTLRCQLFQEQISLFQQINGLTKMFWVVYKELKVINNLFYLHY